MVCQERINPAVIVSARMSLADGVSGKNESIRWCVC